MCFRQLSRSSLKISSAFLWVGLLAGVLTGCSKDEPVGDEDQDSQGQQIQEQENRSDATSRQSDTESGNKSGNTSGITAQPAGTPPAQIAPPQVEVPRDLYVPTKEEIQRAFADVLAKTVMTMPDTPERITWYQEQANQLQSIKVQQCSASYAGSASVCNITFAGRALQIKIMLTTNGWVLVK